MTIMFSGLIIVLQNENKTSFPELYGVINEN